jgi:hypothetical protein
MTAKEKPATAATVSGQFQKPITNPSTMSEGAKGRKALDCNDCECGSDIGEVGLGEMYMTKDDVWLTVVRPRRGCRIYRRTT